MVAYEVSDHIYVFASGLGITCLNQVINENGNILNKKINSGGKFIHYSLCIGQCAICFLENPRMKVNTKLFPKSVTSDSLDGIDKSLLTLVLRNPIAIWVSCGEPFLSPKGKFFVFACFQTSI